MCKNLKFSALSGKIFQRFRAEILRGSYNGLRCPIFKTLQVQRFASIKQVGYFIFFPGWVMGTSIKITQFWVCNPQILAFNKVKKNSYREFEVDWTLGKQNPNESPACYYLIFLWYSKNPFSTQNGSKNFPH